MPDTLFRIQVCSECLNYYWVKHEGHLTVPDRCPACGEAWL